MLARLIDSWLHEIVDQRIVDGIGDLHPPAIAVVAVTLTATKTYTLQTPVTDVTVVVRKRRSLEVLGDDLELLLDDPVHDAVDGVGGACRVLAAEVRRVPQRLYVAGRRRARRRRVCRHWVHAAVKKEIVHVLKKEKEEEEIRCGDHSFYSYSWQGLAQSQRRSALTTLPLLVSMKASRSFHDP